MIGDKIKEKITRIAQKYGLDFVALFGSGARGTSRTGSDIDIAFLSRGLVDISRLAEEVGDAISRNDVEITDLSVPAPFLWRSVAEEGALLFESREGIFSEWKIRAQNLWFDTAPLRARQKAALQSWARAR